ITQNDCVGNSIQFAADATQPPDMVEWDFGDGTTGFGITTEHIYALPGTYRVKAKGRKGSFLRYYCKDIVVTGLPLAIRPPDLRNCGDENGQAVFNLGDQVPVILGPSQTNGFIVTFHTSQADAIAG